MCSRKIPKTARVKWGLGEQGDRQASRGDHRAGGAEAWETAVEEAVGEAVSHDAKEVRPAGAGRVPSWE